VLQHYHFEAIMGEIYVLLN